MMRQFDLLDGHGYLFAPDGVAPRHAIISSHGEYISDRQTFAAPTRLRFYQPHGMLAPGDQLFQIITLMVTAGLAALPGSTPPQDIAAGSQSYDYKLTKFQTTEGESYLVVQTLVVLFNNLIDIQQLPRDARMFCLGSFPRNIRDIFRQIVRGAKALAGLCGSGSERGDVPRRVEIRSAGAGC